MNISIDISSATFSKIVKHYLAQESVVCDLFDKKDPTVRKFFKERPETKERFDAAIEALANDSDFMNKFVTALSRHLSDDLDDGCFDYIFNRVIPNKTSKMLQKFQDEFYDYCDENE